VETGWLAFGLLGWRACCSSGSRPSTREACWNPYASTGTFFTAAETVGRQGYPGYEVSARTTDQRPPNTSVVADDAGRFTVAERVGLISPPRP